MKPMVQDLTIKEGDDSLSRLLARARQLKSSVKDEEAKSCYLEILRRDPTHPAALGEIALLAYASGHRSAARSAYEQLIKYYPGNVSAHTNLGTLLYEEGELERSRFQFETALSIVSDFAQAHRGLARLLEDQGYHQKADFHWRRSFNGQAIQIQPHRGKGRPITVLMLVSVKGGNIPLRAILDERLFAVTTVFVEYFDPALPLPSHSIVLNAVGDADLCASALKRAHEIVAQTSAPIINHPSKVADTGRLANTKRMRKVSGLCVPRMHTVTKNDLLATNNRNFPFLLRAPGYHTGRYFYRIDNPADLRCAISELPSSEMLKIQYIDSRCEDGFWRKYRVMIIGGVLYPLHLAISSEWKVHYFTAGMSQISAHLEEEKQFIHNFQSVLGPRAVSTLSKVAARLALDYAGIDFALRADGEILFFEANATMAIFPAPEDPIWDYRRSPIENAIKAAQQLLLAELPHAA